MVELPSSSPYKHFGSPSHIKWVKVRKSEHGVLFIMGENHGKGFYFFVISTLAKVDSVEGVILFFIKIIGA